MSIYSNTIHQKIQEKISQIKENPCDELFEELKGLFQEKYGDEYISYMTSFFLEPAIFVKVTDSFYEAHKEEFEPLREECEEEDEESEEEEEGEGEEESEEEEEGREECEEDVCDEEACTLQEGREEEEEEGEGSVQMDKILEELMASSEMNEEEKQFIQKLLKGEESEVEEKSEEEDEEGEEEEDEEGEEEEKISDSLNEFISNIEDVVPFHKMSFMMMMLFGVDEDEKEEFVKMLEEKSEKKYTIQQNPFYLNHQKSAYHRFIYQKLKESSGAESESSSSSDEEEIAEDPSNE